MQYLRDSVCKDNTSFGTGQMIKLSEYYDLHNYTNLRIIIDL